MKIFLFLIMLGFILLGCDGDPVSPAGRNYEIPSTVGSYWKYAVYDSVALERDTVEVRIISTLGFSNGQVTKWVFHNLKTIDTVQVTFSSDTINTALYSFSQRYRLIVLSPLSVGLEYNSIYGPMNVQMTENVINESNSFNNCFRVLNATATSTDIDSITYWIKPGIGIVKAHRTYIAVDGEQEVYWDLVDYNIVN